MGIVRIYKRAYSSRGHNVLVCRVFAYSSCLKMGAVMRNIAFINRRRVVVDSSNCSWSYN